MAIRLSNAYRLPPVHFALHRLPAYPPLAESKRVAGYRATRSRRVTNARDRPILPLRGSRLGRIITR
jgi:hypothetical protein